MQGLMQRALADDWDKLPQALQAHYGYGETKDCGHLDIEFPRAMKPLLTLLRVFGILLNRHGRQVAAVVEKSDRDGRQYWRRRIRYADGKVVEFNTCWVSAGGNQLIEFVNPVLGLQMAVHVSDGRLYYRGVRYVVKLGAVMLPVPEWMVLGHTQIEEVAVDANHFAMDFRLIHPLFGQIFRYAGAFEASLRGPSRG